MTTAGGSVTTEIANGAEMAGKFNGGFPRACGIGVAIVNSCRLAIAHASSAGSRNAVVVGGTNGCCSQRRGEIGGGRAAGNGVAATVMEVVGSAGGLTPY